MDETKTEATHTEGPWAVRPQKHDDWGMVRGADGYPVALCATGARGLDEFRETVKYGTPEYDAGPPEMLANANLIAAAPDLLAALRRFVDVTACYCAGDANCEVCQGEAAINKALGKA